jgi:PAS domain S-box-containing protein
LRTLVQTIPDLIWLKNPEGVYLDCNVQFERFFGASIMDIKGKTDYDFVDRELADFFREHDRKAMAAGMSSRNEEWLTFAVDGHRALFETIKTPMLDVEGNLVGVLGIARDITDRKRTENLLRESEQDLRKKNEELTHFNYTISHDLKSPLITIETFLGYLEQDFGQKNAERIEKDVTYIRSAAEKMAGLLDELLQLSRSGRVVSDAVTLPLQSIVQEALNLVAGQIARQGVKIEVTVEPVDITGDRCRLVELFQNLVDNAVKFMGDQPAPRVEIGVSTEAGEAVFFVRDNGIGIDPRHRHKLFGLFEKLDPESNGSGLGLALAKRIVEIHGGRIWAVSEGLGRGSMFCFTLAKTDP